MFYFMVQQLHFNRRCNINSSQLFIVYHLLDPHWLGYVSQLFFLGYNMIHLFALLNCLYGLSSPRCAYVWWMLRVAEGFSIPVEPAHSCLCFGSAPLANLASPISSPHVTPAPFSHRRGGSGGTTQAHASGPGLSALLIKPWPLGPQPYLLHQLCKTLLRLAIS